MQRRRIHRAGAHAIAANAAFHVIRRNAFGHADYGGLGRAVHKPVRQPFDAAAHARHVDDRTAAVGNHARKRGLNHFERRAHVEIERKLPVFIARFENRPLMHKARAVEQNVQRRQALHREFDRHIVEHIQLLRDDPRMTFERFQKFEVHIGCVNRCAFTRHRHCRRAANALPRRRNQRHFSFETFAHLCPLRSARLPRRFRIGSMRSNHYRNDVALAFARISVAHSNLRSAVVDFAQDHVNAHVCSAHHSPPSER